MSIPALVLTTSGLTSMGMSLSHDDGVWRKFLENTDRVLGVLALTKVLMTKRGRLWTKVVGKLSMNKSGWSS